MAALSVPITTPKLIVLCKLQQAACLGSVMVFLALPSLCIAVEPPPDGGYPNQNTAEGEDALFSLQSGVSSNTAIGFRALYNNTTGSLNAALGSNALQNNTTGGANVAVGHNALLGNTTANYNVAIGQNAMVANSTGGLNVAIGYTALQAHTADFGNTAIGYDAMALGTSGDYNTAIGHVAMAFSTGSNNTAIGDGAMNLADGNSNVAIGRSAGLNFAGNTNIAIGEFAGQNVTNGSNNIEIGNQGRPNDANLIRLGDTAVHKKTFVAGINGTTVPNGVAVMVNNKGQLGVATSSVAYKEKIEPMSEFSAAIFSLTPVTFRYKSNLDPESVPQFGLLAEDVAKVSPDLVARDEEGRPYTVRYEAVNAMLLNEFLKEHRKVQTLERLLTEQQTENKAVRALVERHATELEKVWTTINNMAPPASTGRADH